MQQQLRRALVLTCRGRRGAPLAHLAPRCSTWPPPARLAHVAQPGGGLVLGEGTELVAHLRPEARSPNTLLQCHRRAVSTQPEAVITTSARPFQAEKQDFEKLRRAIAVQGSAVQRSEKLVRRLSDEEDEARQEYLARQRATARGRSDLAKQRALLDVSAARAAEAASQLVDRALAGAAPASNLAAAPAAAPGEAEAVTPILKSSQAPRSPPTVTTPAPSAPR
jgi:hypothetical protein